MVRGPLGGWRRPAEDPPPEPDWVTYFWFFVFWPIVLFLIGVIVFTTQCGGPS